MKKANLIFSYLFLATLSLCADQPPRDNAPRTTVELSQGYRHDSLDVKYARGHGKDSVHAKDHFRDVDVYSSRLGVTVSKNDYFLRGIAGYGNIYDGRFHRSLHSKEGDSTFETHKHVHLSGDYTADFAVTLGKNFALCRGFSLAPHIGYGVYLQKFHTNHGRVRVKHKDDFGNSVRRKFHGTKETFRASWYSPQIGLNLTKSFTENIRAYLDYAFLFPLSYHAKAHFDLRHKHDSQIDAENKAYKSFGNILTAGLEWKFARSWSVKPEFELMKFYSKGGDLGHRFRMKHTHRTTYEARLVLGYTF